MKFSFEQDSKPWSIELTPSGRSYRVTIGGETVDVEVLRVKDGRLDLLVDGKRLTAYVSPENTRRWVTVNGQTVMLAKSSGGRGRTQGGPHAAGELTAPMPGQLREVNVSEGDGVTKGQTLLVLEAMKMEIRIHAPQDGVVKKLFVKQGQTVEREQPLLRVEGQALDV